METQITRRNNRKILIGPMNVEQCLYTPIILNFLVCYFSLIPCCGCVPLSLSLLSLLLYFLMPLSVACVYIFIAEYYPKVSLVALLCICICAIVLLIKHLSFTALFLSRSFCFFTGHHWKYKLLNDLSE